MRDPPQAVKTWHNGATASPASPSAQRTKRFPKGGISSFFPGMHEHPRVKCRGLAHNCYELPNQQLPDPGFTQGQEKTMTCLDRRCILLLLAFFLLVSAGCITSWPSSHSAPASSNATPVESPRPALRPQQSARSRRSATTGVWTSCEASRSLLPAPFPTRR